MFIVAACGDAIIRERYKFQNSLLPDTCWSRYLLYVGRALHRQPRVGSPQPRETSTETGWGAALVHMKVIIASYIIR